jgi:hypothetical protein
VQNFELRRSELVVVMMSAGVYKGMGFDSRYPLPFMHRFSISRWLCSSAVNVKWNKEKFQDVELDTNEPPIVFKSQLFALSGVEPDRLKVVIAGKTIEVMI